MEALTAISPLDGRYARDVAELGNYFSELALIKFRLLVEVEYLIALAREAKVTELPKFSVVEEKKLRAIYQNFSRKEGKQIKSIEVRTNHDVKAVEYWFRKNLAKLGFEKGTPFIHFALTSEDVDNLAHALMWQGAVQSCLIPLLTDLKNKLQHLARTYRTAPLLARTHGQPATPTTFGKEMAVFVVRLERQLTHLKKHQLQGKLNGATGTWAAHTVSYPTVDWVRFSKKFITALGLEPNLTTTQIEPHDSMVESYEIFRHINSIFINFTRDIWLYMSRGLLAQKNIAREVGSSTMPHKINPIYFENAEGNLGLANAYLQHLSEKLPVSRLQRDLTDKTVIRNQGVPLAHSLLAYKNILRGLDRLVVNTEAMRQELGEHWEVLAEAIQTVLRKHGDNDAYETLKKLTRGRRVTKETMRDIIRKLNLPASEKEKLLDLTPESYTGLAGL